MKVTYKLFFAVIITVMMLPASFSQTGNWIPLSQGKTTLTEIKLISQINDESVISFAVNGYNLKKVITEKGMAWKVVIPDGTTMQDKGAPDVPKLTTSIIVPDDKKMNIELISSDYIEIQDLEIAPSKGVLSRTDDPSKIPFTYGTVYQTNMYYPNITPEMGHPYIARDFRGQAVTVFPVQYNPVTKVLRIYKNITVKVKPEGPSDINIISKKPSGLKTSDIYRTFYANHFLNYNELSQAKYNPLGETGRMLIICHDAFAAAMGSFVNWKIQKGIQTELVNVSTIGNNASAIKNFVTNYYNTNGLTFLLLVGDHAQVNTSSNGSDDSDQDYGCISGSDHYADIIVGRFSAETLLDVTVQVERTIKYEKELSGSDTWLSQGVGIASDQGGNGQGDLGESDIVHMDFIRDTLLNNGYISVDQIYDPGATDATLATALNSGRGIINYVGHGSDFSFVTTGFDTTDVNALTNIDKLPFIYSVACVNGNFKTQTCFAEAWLRANQAGKPTGAIATAMSTINQSWDSPMCGQDEMDRLTMKTIAGNTKETFGGIVLCGLGKMIDNYAADGEQMADTWTIFGDPSLLIRTKTPQAMTVSHQPVTFIGTNSFVVNCDVVNALICLSMNGQILGTGYGNGTNASISFNTLTMQDTITVTVTAQNYITYTGEVAVVPNAGAYLVCNSQVVNDISANNNQIAEYGESVGLDIAIKNVGVVASDNVTATISTNDTYVTITQNQSSFGLIPDGGTVTNTLAYSFHVAGIVPDNHPVVFNMIITDANDSTWNTSFSVTLRSPSLGLQYASVDDPAGNLNHNLDPGENADIIVNILNNSISASDVSTCTLSTTSSYITINNSIINPGILSGNSNNPGSFGVTVSSLAPAGGFADFTCEVVAGDYSYTLQFSLSIGLIGEDWECASMTHYNWVNGGDLPWQVDSVEKYEGAYSLRSGPIPNSGTLEPKTSQFMITLDVLVNDSISFFKKVSCEDSPQDDYDFLIFLIDSVEMGRWDSETGWSRSSYAVSTGIHELKWVYSKDYTVTGGQDRAWVDNIVFPPFSPATFIYKATAGNTLNFEVFPNPVTRNNFVNATWNLPEKINNGTIELHSIFGQKLNTISIKTDKGNILIPTGNLPEGIYFVTLKAGNKTIATTKLIIK